MGERNGVVRAGAGVRVRRAGFTLIEVMIVIAIVLALSGLVAVSLFQRQDQAKADLAKVDINTLKSALRQFRLDYGRYPTDEEGVRVLWDKEALDGEEDAEKWQPYLEEPLPTDRWGNEWVYMQASEDDETRFELRSNGPDGEEGTEDDISARPEQTDEGGGFDDLPVPTGG